MKNRRILYIFPIVWMGLIFYFSHQRGEESSQVSSWFTNFVESIAEILHIDITGWDVHFLVRKGAHFTVYAVLGLLLFAAFYINRGKLFSSSITAVIIGGIYGVFDELHQYFVPGRSCQLRDMLIDASGVLTAVLLCTGFILTKRYLASLKLDEK